MTTRLIPALLLLGLVAQGCAVTPTGGSSVPEGLLFAPSVAEVSAWGPAVSTGLAMPSDEEEQDEAEDDDGHGLLMGVALYLPNRIFDLLDIVRLRLRVGPGLRAGVRATKPLSAGIGFYSGIFAGIHGPRGEDGGVPWPVGFEAAAGAQASVLDAEAGGPYYGVAEIGADAQLALIGAAIGVDPWELVDFLTGIVTIDLVGDDY